MYEDALEGIGLTKNEAKVYLTLLKLGSTTTGAVVKETGLHRLERPDVNKVRVEVYRGKEGLKTGLNDILKEGKDYYMIGCMGAARDLAKHWFAHWQKRRVKMKIMRTVLFPNNMKGQDATRYRLTRKKFLPKGHFIPASTIIYGTDKVLIFIPIKDDFLGIIIRSREVWESYKSEFDVLWNSLREERKRINKLKGYKNYEKKC
jgi:sugar-specific transcriptional regulator TrmB